ncbi:MAG: hypothetical protein ACI4M5_05270 [Christensenellales bacterium]
MKKNKSRKKLVLLIFNLILSIVIFVITYFIDPLQYATNSSLSAIPAFLFSIIVLIIGQTIVIHNETEKVEEDSELICETVKNYLHITKIGTPKYAWDYIMNRLPILEYVQNTSFNFMDEIEQSNERLYGGVSYQQSFNKIANQVNQGLIWKDIGDSTALDRFKRTKEKVTSKSKGQYQYKLISQSEPQIGFIILTYRDGSTEVLFNWDFREIPQDPVVLLSRDQEIINMFAAQYKSLWNIAVEDYDNKATKSTS